MCLWVWFSGFEKLVPTCFCEEEERKKKKEEEEKKKWPLEWVCEEERKKEKERRRRSRDGIGAGRVQRTGFLPLPRKILSCPIPVPSPHDGENFLAPSSPLGASPHLVKLYFFLLICPTISIIFLMKPI